MEADYNVLTFEQQMRYNLMTGVRLVSRCRGLVSSRSRCATSAAFEQQMRYNLRYNLLTGVRL